MSSAATSYFDNAASSVQGQGAVPWTQLSMRETGSRLVAGQMMLVPPQAPRYLLVPNQQGPELRVYDLLRPPGPGVAIVLGQGTYVFNAAISADGGSIFLGCKVPSSLHVYDTAHLLEAASALPEGGQAEAEDQISPRGWAPNIPGQTECAGAAFSQDATRLFVLWKTASAITVHDPSHPELLVLRELPFSGGNFQYGNSQLACAGGLLAACAGGSFGSAPPTSSEEAGIRRRVKMWQVGVDGETDLCTVSNPDLADSVAIRPDGGLLAVGLRNGMVRLLSPAPSDDMGEEQEVLVELEPMKVVHGDPMVNSLCFSRDGAKLVVGRSGSDDFVVYDVASAAAVARFVQPKSQGGAATFFPAGDVLVTGALTVAQPCVFHRVLGPAPRIELALSDSADITSNDLVLNDELGAVVAMASGSMLEVRTERGKVLLQQDLGEQMFTSISGFRTAVRLHPGLKFVACVLAKKVVVVLLMAGGSELLRFSDTGGSCFGPYWSPNGALLAVPTFTGARLFSVDAGFAEVHHLASETCVFGFAFDSSGTRAATASGDGRVTVWDVTTGKPTRTFHFGPLHMLSVCFSNNGDRLAFGDATPRVGVVSLDADDDDEPLLVVKPVNAVTGLQFSPDNQFLLCCPSQDRPVDQHRMRVLDLTTGTDAKWGDLLRTMALPVTGGLLYGRSMGWAQLPRAHSFTADTTEDDTTPSPSWVLYGAVGKRFVALDIQDALHAIHDNAWTVDQLTFCVTDQPEHVGTVVESCPHCSNIRDEETGETVLHRLARMHNADLMGIWLEKCPYVTPVANAEGHTASEVAMQLEQADVAQALWRRLAPSLTSMSASLVLQELRALSNSHPNFVQTFLLDVEPKLVRTLATFRTELTQMAEVCGLPTPTLGGSSNDDELASEPKNATDWIPSVWTNKCPADSPKTLVASKVVVLPHLLGDADSSPFHAIVTHCDASVFESKLLQLIVQQKWEENVRSKRLRSVVLYGFAFLMGASAMISSVTNAISVASSTADALQGLTVVIEVTSLGVEALELGREGCALYFTGPWNVLDVVSSVLVLVGSLCHFMGAVDGLRTAGALGVALKCFGMVDYLRSWSATGSLVRMISVIITDMVPFMVILSFAMLGCMLFFTINLSSSPDFDSGSGLGLFRTLVTVYHMTLGIGTGIDTEHASVATVVVVSIFMSFVVVVLLNLLIAIMGDSYEKVKESEHVEAIRERARIIVEEEKRFPQSHRYHRFMHYVEAADSAGQLQEIMWEGVTKRITLKMKTEIDRLDDGLVEMKNDLVQMNGKLEDELVQLKSEMNSKFQMILDRLK